MTLCDSCCAGRVDAAPAPVAAEWDNSWGGDDAESVPAPPVSARKPVLPSSLKSPTTASERPPVQAALEAVSSPASRRARAAKGQPAGAETASGWDEDW